MVEATIPFAGTEIDTDDPGEAAQDYGLLVGGLVLLFSAVGIASYAYQRVKDVAGMDGETEVPGL